jgi:hypothetical protein
MKKYIAGYYCSNDSELGVIGKESSRAILNTLRQHYPLGLNAYEIEEKTRLPLKTVYPSLKELHRELFIREVPKQPNKPGRPITKDSRGIESDRYRSSFVVEDMSRIYEHVVSPETTFNYPLAPGNVDYPNGFLDAWHASVEKKEEDEICSSLLAFLEKILRRINEHNAEEIRTWAPTVQKQITMESKAKKKEDNTNFCCGQCGINHEARDFIRAVLLHLLDHLEKNDNFIRFMKENEFINQEVYKNMIATKVGRFKERGMNINL